MDLALELSTKLIWAIMHVWTLAQAKVWFCLYVRIQEEIIWCIEYVEAIFQIGKKSKIIIMHAREQILWDSYWFAFSIKQKIAFVGLYGIHQKNVTKGMSEVYATNRTCKEFYCQLKFSGIIRVIPNFLGEDLEQKFSTVKFFAWAYRKQRNQGIPFMVVAFSLFWTNRINIQGVYAGNNRCVVHEICISAI